MCNVTIYRGAISEDKKLWEDVSGYEISLEEGTVHARRMLGEEKVFTVENTVSWDARKDALII